VSAASVSRLRVRYAETDQMGVAWHGNYFAWFEVGRTDLLRGRGLSYRELEATGVRLPVLEARASYHRPARYDDVLEIHTRVESRTGARLAFAYEVRREGTAELLAEGFTNHVAVDDRGRPRRLPAALRELLA
jgi:acyl-CoA thioester hydrolase